MGTALPAPLHSARLHGAARWPPVSGTASRIVIQGRGMGAVSKMHGMRWKVNSDTETEERGETKGDGLLEAESVIKKMKDHILVLALHCLRCSFVLLLT